MGTNVLLGVSGSVAAYRACDLARELMRAGCDVRVCLTDGASQFVTHALFEALTGNPCLAGVFEEPEPGRMAHIDWARWAELILVAPATANSINALAAGLGGDMLTTIVLASAVPLLVAPAMNPQMYQSEQVQGALRALSARGAWVIEPAEGEVACGEEGQGKLAANHQIVEAVLAVASRSRCCEGKTLLLTCGPTRESIDNVRFLSNRSSGRMGAAIAQAALWMGAKVQVVSGPISVPLPLAAEVHRVETAKQMLEAAMPLAPTADVIIGAAAVADFRPANPVVGKLRRADQPLELRLAPNPDIIAALASAASPDATVVGFAAEPNLELQAAREKMRLKGLHAICVNDISRADAGFEVTTNELTLIRMQAEPESSGLRSKLGCALWLLERISRSL